MEAAQRQIEGQTYLNVAAVAGMLGVTRGRVKQLVMRGQVPSVKVGRYLFIPEEAIRERAAQQAEMARAVLARLAGAPDTEVTKTAYYVLGGRPRAAS
jgi:hypothetical protein